MAIEITTLPNVVSSRVTKRCVGYSDNGSGGWTACVFDIRGLGVSGKTNVNASRVITAADQNGGVLVANSAGSLILTLPTMYRLGIVPVDTENPVLAFRRGGLGLLFVTPAVYRGSVASQAAMLALSPVTPEDYCYRSDLGQFFILTTGSPATLGNWLAVTIGAANEPVIPSGGDTGVMVDWGLDSAFDPQYQERYTTIQIEGMSLDHWIAG